MIKSRPNKDGKLRHQVLVYDPSTKSGKRTVGTFATKREAKAAEAKEITRDQISETVASFGARWTIDFPRHKESSNIHNRERTKQFIEEYGNLPMHRVDFRIVNEYLSRGNRNGTVPKLRAMFNDALDRHIVAHNPFARLGIKQSKGNAQKHPPTEDQVMEMLAYAWEHCPPSFAAWLEVATDLGTRPGEQDGLEWSKIDWDKNEVLIDRQFNSTSCTFTLPKNDHVRTISLNPRSRAVLERLPRESKYVFSTQGGAHYGPSTRTSHWNAVRAAVGLEDKSLYLCTRHYAGWYMVNVLGLDAPVVANQFGHQDGGRLVEILYGHRDKKKSRETIRKAYEDQIYRERKRAS